MSLTAVELHQGNHRVAAAVAGSAGLLLSKCEAAVEKLWTAAEQVWNCCRAGVELLQSKHVPVELLWSRCEAAAEH